MSTRWKTYELYRLDQPDNAVERFESSMWPSTIIEHRVRRSKGEYIGSGTLLTLVTPEGVLGIRQVGR